MVHFSSQITLIRNFGAPFSWRPRRRRGNWGYITPLPRPHFHAPTIQTNSFCFGEILYISVVTWLVMFYFRSCIIIISCAAYHLNYYVGGCHVYDLIYIIFDHITSCQQNRYFPHIIINSTLSRNIRTAVV